MTSGAGESQVLPNAQSMSRGAWGCLVLPCTGSPPTGTAKKEQTESVAYLASDFSILTHVKR